MVVYIDLNSFMHRFKLHYVNHLLEWLLNDKSLVDTAESTSLDLCQIKKVLNEKRDHFLARNADCERLKHLALVLHQSILEGDRTEGLLCEQWQQIVDTLD